MDGKVLRTPVRKHGRGVQAAEYYYRLRVAREHGRSVRAAERYYRLRDEAVDLETASAPRGTASPAGD